MESVRQSCRPKHQVLILKCYPKYQKGVQEVKPNSSELSYLLYYVSTRRSKLTKVGAFLEKRAARDVWRRRLGNVQVTLQILSALIEKVPRDLPIYARFVLTVIETVLRSNEISMVEDSILTFETFCRHQDVAALTAEQDFASQYRNVVRLYADFADPNSSAQARTALSPQIAIRWRNAGLRAIKGVVSPEGLFDEGVELLKIVLPVILKNLYSGEEGLLVSLHLQLQESEKKDLDQLSQDKTSSTPAAPTPDTTEGDAGLALQSTADADKQAEMETRLLALRCLERIIVSGSSRGQVRTATGILLQFITTESILEDGRRDEDSEVDSKGDWATSLIELVAKWCPVQIRFVILVTAMEILLDTDITNLQRASTLVRIVDWLLKSSANMIGLSVMDVLLGLLRTISRVLRYEPRQQMDESKGAATNGTDVSEKAQSPDTPPDETARSRLLVLLKQCIGSLATHIYYAGQVADMIRAILIRVRSPGNQENFAESTADQSSGAIGTGINTIVTTQSDTRLTFGTGKVIALKAVKNILLVANSSKHAATAGVIFRKKVGIHVWEGTQWLLHDSEQNVRYAYVDAFLTWLKLETDSSDLGVQIDAEKQPRLLSKQGFLEPVEKKPGKRANPSSSSKSERAQSNFFRLLHLAVYEVALEFPTRRSDFLLLHLLLASVVERLGVNAVRFGLPMILRLQDDKEAVTSFAASVNIGSLVYGYLLAICEKFNLKDSRIGLEIVDEVEKRKSQGSWLQGIDIPPVPLDNIVSEGAETEYQASSRSGNAGILLPFQSVEELVHYVDQAYRRSMASPAQSPSVSPTRGSAISYSNDAKSQKSTGLPTVVKEQMLSNWSKEACLAAVESENATSASTHGSRYGAATIRDHHQVNGNGALEDSQKSANSQVSSQHGTPGVQVTGATGLEFPDDSGSSPAHNTSRDLPVRVNELRRVLSVGGQENQPRRSSPLRGRLDSSTNKSDDPSSGESMASGSAYSVSDAGDRASIRTRSVKDGLETPRPVTPKPWIRENGQSDQQPQLPYNYMDPDDIPPVPPIPQSLSNTPGGQQNDYRPFTAPSLQRRSSKSSGKGNANNNNNSKTGTAASAGRRKSKSLTRHKSNSRTGLADSPFASEYYSHVNGHHYQGQGYDAPQSALEGSLEPSERDDLRRLLDGYLSSSSSSQYNANATGSGDYDAASTYLQGESRGQERVRGNIPRRKSTGIGKPPY